MSRGGFSSARLVEIWMFAAGINNDGRVGQYRKLENLRLCDNYEVRLSGELHTMLIAEKSNGQNMLSVRGIDSEGRRERR
jgi:hypothetical protein